MIAENLTGYELPVKAVISCSNHCHSPYGQKRIVQLDIEHEEPKTYVVKLKWAEQDWIEYQADRIIEERGRLELFLNGEKLASLDSDQYQSWYSK